MTPDQIRESFLRFFEERGHTRVASASLVPENDPSLLFTGAGMNQFKDEFLGKGRRGLKRATSSQKCLRTGDLDNVGRTAGHHSFFEMLGNFSFGDYFKAHAVAWAYQFLTTEMAIAPARLVVTVYEDDDEAYRLWTTERWEFADIEPPRVPAHKVFKLGAKSNFWPSNAPTDGPNGPCGPCSEIFFDYGPQAGCPLAAVGKPCDPSCDCGQYIEVWNLVFTQFDRQDGGKLVPLPQKNIDTGMGFERLTAVKEGVHATLHASLFRPILDAIAKFAGKSGYVPDGEDGVRTRRIADHVRSGVFLVSDGVRPSNEGRGYVLRRILRRAIRDGAMLGIEKPFLPDLAPLVATAMEHGYPELRAGIDGINGVLAAEEAQFRRTFASGMSRLERAISDLLGASLVAKDADIARRKKAAGFPGAMPLPKTDTTPKQLPGDLAFQLHDTFGFPIDMTVEICAERQIKVDLAEFNRLMEEQRERARGARKMTSDIFERGPLGDLAEHGVGPTQFLGYGDPNAGMREERRGIAGRGKLVGVILRDELHQEIRPGEKAEIILDRTPFYAEAGGQIGDAGEIRFSTGVFRVEDTKAKSGYSLHAGTFEGTGPVKAGDPADCVVSADRRDAIRRNHTGTHILHKALKEVLGETVNQQGSLVAPDRLRFDFTFPRSLTTEEIRAIEDRVNREVLQNEPLRTDVLPVEEAKRTGAVALFGEKYPDTVRVVAVGGYSRELCGGTHCRAAGDIGSFRITSEGSIASGIRRIEAVTGEGALKRMQEDRDTLTSLSHRLGVPPAEIEARLEKLQADLKAAKKRAVAAPAAGFDPAAGESVEHAGLRVAVQLVDRPRDEIVPALEALGKREGEALAALVVTTEGGKVTAIVAGSPAAVARGFDATAFLKAAGGRGGGKRHFAQGTFPGTPTAESLRAGAAKALESVAGA